MSVFILCITIFFARILDVSLGTVRTILIVKGKRLIASLTGFFEVMIWFAIVKEALNTDETGFWVMTSYAGGFAVGTYIGSLLSEYFIRGNFGVQVITEKKDIIINTLREKGYGVSVIDIKGRVDNKYMLFIEIDKKQFNSLRSLIKNLDSKAFIVVTETKFVQNGYFK